jgi:hypothetical protein
MYLWEKIVITLEDVIVRSGAGREEMHTGGMPPLGQEHVGFTTATPTAPYVSDPAGAITVLLADSRRLVRAGFRQLLEGATDVVVTAEATSTAEAVERAALTQPNVALLASGLVGGSIAACRQLHTTSTAVVVIAAHD